MPFDLQEKLTFWEKNGYVILENIIPENLVDLYMKDVEELIQHKDQYSTEIRIDLPEYVKNPVQPISAVPMDILMGRYIKINDFHNQSVYGKKLMLHSGIVGFYKPSLTRPQWGCRVSRFCTGANKPPIRISPM